MGFSYLLVGCYIFESYLQVHDNKNVTSNLFGLIFLFSSIGFVFMNRDRIGK